MRVRTGYSFKTAVGHVPEVVARIKEIGWTVAPITDRMSTYGYVNWTKAAEETGLRPIYGVELPVCLALGERKPIYDWWTFIAISELEPLNRLVYQATLNKGLTYEQAQAARGLVRIVGERANLGAVRPAADLYMALSPSLPRGLYRAAREAGHKFIATSDNYYTNAGDGELYKVALGFRASTQTYPQHILSDEEWIASAGYASADDKADAMKNRRAVVEQCWAKLTTAFLFHPKVKKTLRRMCEDGAKKLKVDIKSGVYRERLDRELGLIKEKEYEDYFFIVADLMQWSRKHMVVGPARGSSCGSLVCYLLGITSIDPIPYDLVFERFVDITRSDLPDIDLDFSDERRHLAIEYVAKKYGQENVARLGSVNMIQAKSALNLIGPALRIPQWQITEVGNTVIKRSFGDSRASSTVIDTLEETDVGRKMLLAFPAARIAGRLEDHPASAGQHAAGVVITAEPIVKYVAVNGETGSAMCDKYDAETLNLMKIDMLGLTQLSIFEQTLRLIGESPRSDFLEAIPTDDPAAFEVLNSMRFSGIFQFVPGSALANLIKRMVKNMGGRVERLDDLVALTALVRPGPLGSGMTDSWMKRRTANEVVSYPHPLLEPYLRDTLGLVIYQEQIMKIGKEIGDLSWEETISIRRAMGRSLGKEFFDQFGDRWIAGAVKKGMPGTVATHFWNSMVQFGMFSFNKSHSVAYGLLSYWCCWLKSKFPVEFAAATLDATADQAKQVTALRELREEGVDYVPFDAVYSTDRWGIKTEGDRRVLVGPLTNIRGIGPSKVRDILDARASGDELRPSIAKALAGARTSLDTLTPIADAVARACPDLGARGILSTPTSIDGVEGGRQVLILARVAKVQPLNENEISRVARRNGRKFDGPVEALNLFFQDDTGEIFAKIDRWQFPVIGRDVVAQARVGKSLYAVKGDVPSDFRMIRITAIRHLGEMT